MDDERHRLAMELFGKAYRLQMQGDLDLAVDLYRRSISVWPTAEAHTFLGWTYHLQGKIEAAIDECKRAIEVDPTLGNPYNDIGSYLIDLNRHQEAIEWLEQATRAQRYENYHYPWFNLGRAYQRLELYSMARECFQHALEIESTYQPALDALDRVRRLIQ